ncbi:hypothetical protein TNCV_4457301 [Trichonephila clavipes]|nr:hypothetical protein TNCV_4457301 [Trichonephila clavipes]
MFISEKKCNRCYYSACGPDINKLLAFSTGDYCCTCESDSGYVWISIEQVTRYSSLENSELDNQAILLTRPHSCRLNTVETVIQYFEHKVHGRLRDEAAKRRVQYERQRALFISLKKIASFCKGACDLVTDSWTESHEFEPPLMTRRVEGDAREICRSSKVLPLVWKLGKGMPAQVSSSSPDHGSKLRGPSPKAFE